MLDINDGDFDTIYAGRPNTGYVPIAKQTLYNHKLKHSLHYIRCI